MKLVELAEGEVFIRKYRGYDIIQVAIGNFEVRDGAYKQTSCGSAWSCITWIDERLSP